MNNNSHFPKVSPYLLWEYNLNTFNFQKSGFIVIERVIERGKLEDWIEIFNFYGVEKILQVAQSSRQLSQKDKHFTEVFVQSQFLDAV